LGSKADKGHHPKMKNRKKIKVIIEKNDTGFSAFAVDYPVLTTGDTMNKLIDNINEAFSLYCEPEKFDNTLLSLELDFKQFFQYYKVINSKTLAEKIGMNPTLLSQYVRGHKKPSKQQSRKIVYGINRIGQELAEMSVIYETMRAESGERRAESVER
jgi:predicted RNase H-like HicB family nuclease